MSLELQDVAYWIEEEGRDPFVVNVQGGTVFSNNGSGRQVGDFARIHSGGKATPIPPPGRMREIYSEIGESPLAISIR